MTLMEKAQAGQPTPDIEQAAKDENINPETLMELLATGRAVVLSNRVRERLVRPIAVGKSLRTKVNANLGSSSDKAELELELKKLEAAVEAKADTVMDLSTGGDLRRIREAIIAKSPVPIGTVPIYETAVALRESGVGIVRMTDDDLFGAIESQAKEGVDFVTVHCGVTQAIVERIVAGERVMGIVSRGGAFLASWIHYNERENPLYEHFDRLLDIARKYELVLSLGDGLRPGCLADASDALQIGELSVLGELVRRSRDAGVQVMVEGPGHIPIQEIVMNIQLQKSLCDEAPFYVLGPLVTDIAPGYDHITSAIGGAIAASAGADFLCYVTRTEHLSLPDEYAVREGVIVTRIAAHTADIAKGYPAAMDWDNAMASARANLDWRAQIELAIDPERAQSIRDKLPPADRDVCTMCGEYCALKMIGEIIPEAK